ncbi:MAG TPA: winged helix DNA-binding domain-containing protein [Vicinamibacterales bacterium]
MAKGKLKSAAPRSLDIATLNRTLLARQHLLKRTRASVLQALEHLVGMQAQMPTSPYVGLWSRLARFRHDQLADLITSRQAVRIALMRNTLHLVTADDCLTIRPVVQPVMARAYRNADGATLRTMIAAGRAILETQPRTNVEIGRLLKKQFPRHDRMVLGYAIRDNLALVQIPPRGLWGQRCAPILTTVKAWLGRSLADSSTPDRVILRYLAAFGPASVADIQAWSGLPGLRGDVDRLRPRLRVHCDERGRELFDVPEGRLSRATVPAPARFLPEYDNVLVAYADRSRIIPPEHQERVMRQLGRPPVLVDGFVRGFWRVSLKGTAATLEIRAFDGVARRRRGDLESEGLRLLRFVAGDATPRVTFTTA